MRKKREVDFTLSVAKVLGDGTCDGCGTRTGVYSLSSSSKERPRFRCFGQMCAFCSRGVYLITRRLEKRAAP